MKNQVYWVFKPALKLNHYPGLSKTQERRKKNGNGGDKTNAKIKRPGRRTTRQPKKKLFNDTVILDRRVGKSLFKKIHACAAKQKLSLKRSSVNLRETDPRVTLNNYFPGYGTTKGVRRTTDIFFSSPHAGTARSVVAWGLEKKGLLY